VRFVTRTAVRERRGVDAPMERRQRIWASVASAVRARLKGRVRRFLGVWVVAVAALALMWVFGGHESREHGSHLVTAEALVRRGYELGPRRLDLPGR
jgi:hypothetical protein